MAKTSKENEQIKKELNYWITIYDAKRMIIELTKYFKGASLAKIIMLDPHTISKIKTGQQKFIKHRNDLLVKKLYRSFMHSVRKTEELAKKIRSL